VVKKMSFSAIGNLYHRFLSNNRHILVVALKETGLFRLLRKYFPMPCGPGWELLIPLKDKKKPRPERNDRGF
jgi:hypothetical protein